MLPCSSDTTLGNGHGSTKQPYAEDTTIEGHLERLRRQEIDTVQPWFRPGTRILDLGGGSGFQASLLTARGCEVISIDLPDRPQAPRIYFPVQDYDGRRIPAADGSFDIVFSSNVLEHIRQLPLVLRETQRVLKPGGIAVHVVPSASWRAWTCIAHFPFVLKSLLDLGNARARVTSATSIDGQKSRWRYLAKVVSHALPLFAHGEYPNALAELYFFRRDRWTRVFEQNEFIIRSVEGNGIFYTGYELFPGLSLSARQWLARWLGSACHIFVLQASMPDRPPGSQNSFETEVEAGQRFEFGKNWQRFLSVLDDERIAEAEQSLKEMLGVTTLAGKTFLDVGSGSGLFSLAAIRLGAERVHSFDYDPKSVACTQELKRRYFPEATQWTIERGNVLDRQYLRALGEWDIVYSWGVLHHTGDLWSALANVSTLVKTTGLLFISIYNDQGLVSRGWKAIKRLYNRGELEKRFILAIFVPYFAFRGVVGDLVRGDNPLHGFAAYKRIRGMSRVHDWLDWLGGYPFEVAEPERIFDFYRDRAFVLERLKTCGGRLGCNEFVFRKQ